MSERDDNTSLEELAPVDQAVDIPEMLPILPLRDTVLFPNSFMPLAVARESSVTLVDDAMSAGKVIGVFTQREPSVDEPGQADLYGVGTASQIHKMFKLPDGSLRLIVQGLGRVTLTEVVDTKPYLRARVAQVPEVAREEDRLEIDAQLRNIKGNFSQVVSLSPLLSEDLQTLAANITDPGRLADFIASSLSSSSSSDDDEEDLESLDHGHCRQAGGAGNGRPSRAARRPEPHPGEGTGGARAGFEAPVAGAV